MPSSLLFFRTDSKLIRINQEDIIALSKSEHYVNVFMKEGKYLIRGTLSDFLKVADNNIFYRVHRSAVVSVLHITYIEKDYINLGEIGVPFSENYSKPLFEAIKIFG